MMNEFIKLRMDTHTILWLLEEGMLLTHLFIIIFFIIWKE